MKVIFIYLIVLSISIFYSQECKLFNESIKIYWNQILSKSLNYFGTSSLYFNSIICASDNTHIYLCIFDNIGIDIIIKEPFDSIYYREIKQYFSTKLNFIATYNFFKTHSFYFLDKFIYFIKQLSAGIIFKVVRDPNKIDQNCFEPKYIILLPLFIDDGLSYMSSKY